MIYVYGIGPSDTALTEPIKGLADAEVRPSYGGGLTAFVSEVEAELQTDEAALWAHERVVERIMDGTTVIPARFGTLFPDEDALHSTMAAHQDTLQDVIRRVEGMAEIGVRVIHASDAGSEVEPQDGREYLMRKVHAERRTKEIARSVEDFHETLAAAAADDRARWFVTDRLVLSGAYLVPSGEVADFKSLVSGAPHPADVQVLCTGPWPPYNFVEAVEEEE